MCGQFLSVAADLLPSLYSPELLADEADWTALPGLHQGALYALRAMACRAAGPETARGPVDGGDPPGERTCVKSAAERASPRLFLPKRAYVFAL